MYDTFFKKLNLNSSDQEIHINFKKKFHGVIWFVSLYRIVLFSILLLIIWFFIASDNKKAFHLDAHHPLADM